MNTSMFQQFSDAWSPSSQEYMIHKNKDSGNRPSRDCIMCVICMHINGHLCFQSLQWYWAIFGQFFLCIGVKFSPRRLYLVQCWMHEGCWVDEDFTIWKSSQVSEHSLFSTSKCPSLGAIENRARVLVAYAMSKRPRVTIQFADPSRALYFEAPAGLKSSESSSSG